LIVIVRNVADEAGCVVAHGENLRIAPAQP
jgi:hypothetical protein